MKLKKILLRWYKSFHLNYRGGTERGETRPYRPWNRLSPKFALNEEFPFLEIPIEHDITTIVGANESGKSHLLNAIAKVVRGVGLDGEEKFKKTDLCHYSSIRTRNVEAWPNIGLVFSLTDPPGEAQRLKAAIGDEIDSAVSTSPTGFALILCPDESGHPAQLILEPGDHVISLRTEQLEAVRALLPSVQFIDSTAKLASEVPIGRLLAAYGDESFRGVGLPGHRAVETAMKMIKGLSIPVAQQPTPEAFVNELTQLKQSLLELTSKASTEEILEMQLFREILGITRETLHYLYQLPPDDRGYIEGQVGKWNEELESKLNLSHFWRQDEQFSLSMNLKDNMIYFEIRDKTDSVYTFRERSSGLKFFLSYYIQAKALELSSRNKNSIILMDEPDSALSILGQRNLLAVFESLVGLESSGQNCQLIYSTHSPYLINRNFPRRIRVVKKEEAEEGTQYIEQARIRRYEPVRTALGIDSAPSLFLGSDNVLVEGATDQYVFVELIRLFSTPQNVGEFLDLNAVVFVSADGVGNVENVIDQSRWADEPIPPTVVVMDSDKAADDVVKSICNPSRKKGVLIEKSFVGLIGEIVPPFSGTAEIVTAEDIIPRSLYFQAVRDYCERWLPDTWAEKGMEIEDLLREHVSGSTGMVETVKGIYRTIKPETDGDIDKMGVLQLVLERVGAMIENNAGRGEMFELDESITLLKANVVKICDFIRESLDRARTANARISATQSVKRLVSDFFRLNKSNVPITAIQKLLKRLTREVRAVGTDGDGFVVLAGQLLNELEKKRAAGQERIAGQAWDDWEKRLKAIKSNPLNASRAIGLEIEVGQEETRGDEQSEATVELASTDLNKKKRTQSQGA